MTEAILREKRLKKWDRGWKVNSIEAENPTWTDLWDQICQLRTMDFALAWMDLRLRGDDRDLCNDVEID